MILFILELVMFFSGLYMLISGKTIGKDSVKHTQVRFLGLVLACQLPFAIVSIFIIAIVALILDPSAAQSNQLPTWAMVTGGILEWGSYLLCAWVWASWSRRIKAKFVPPLAPPPGTAPGALAHPVAPEAAADPEEPDDEFIDEDVDEGEAADEDDDVEQPPVNR